tara:strand:+ start:2026 stop:3366 length:1341 start_codon:yes stop_codon:yes gene_type:complete
MSKQHRNSKSKFNRRRGTTGGEFFGYTFVTGGDFYGIKVGNSIDDFINFDQNTSTTPEVVINGTTAILDYSSCEIRKDLDYLNVAFDSLVSGNTFNISNGTYYDPSTEQYADISGTYTYENQFANLVIKATFDNLTNTPTGMVRYSSEYFSDVPQIALLGTAAANEKQFTIKNYLGTDASPSFTNIGVRKDDYIFIGDSSTNKKPLKVDDFYLDPNGTEVLILGNSGAAEEDRIGTTSDIKLYRDLSSETTFSHDYNRIEILKVTVEKENDKYYFVINGVKQPTLQLIRGVTYIVDQTHPSNYRGPNNIRLPMRISKIRDGLYNQSDAQSINSSIYFTDGVSYPRTEGNIFMIEPRFIKNSSIYYFCDAQSGMGGEFTIDGTYSIYDLRISGPAAVPPLIIVNAEDRYRQLRSANRVSIASLGAVDGTLPDGSSSVNSSQSRTVGY